MDAGVLKYAVAPLGYYFGSRALGGEAEVLESVLVTLAAPAVGFFAAGAAGVPGIDILKGDETNILAVFAVSGGASSYLFYGNDVRKALLGAAMPVATAKML